jgi:hypothetical protein
MKLRHLQVTPSNLDIYRSAKLLIDQYGDGASLHAANRCDEMLDAGDLDGRAVWSRIYEAVLELSRTEPGEGERVQ